MLRPIILIAVFWIITHQLYSNFGGGAIKSQNDAQNDDLDFGDVIETFCDTNMDDPEILFIPPIEHGKNATKILVKIANQTSEDGKNETKLFVKIANKSSEDGNNATKILGHIANLSISRFDTYSSRIHDDDTGKSYKYLCVREDHEDFRGVLLKTYDIEFWELVQMYKAIQTITM